MNETINQPIDIDISGYLEGENDPGCVTEVFDLNGRKVD